MTDLRYPIGPFQWDGDTSPPRRASRVDEIAAAPAKLRAAVQGLTPDRIDTPYRPGGWTVRQVVHHLPDSHLNAYTRFKLALTEDAPVIKPYLEARWAELPDTRVAAIEISVALLDALHARWVALLRSMTAEQFARGFRHPELGRTLTLDETLALYAWHGRHHVAHVTSLRERQAW
ncbi:MAG: YfiT family bacillithiol transferase [Candidatus Eiseniibacteriota bacterium]